MVICCRRSPLFGGRAADNSGMSEREATLATVTRLMGCCLLAALLAAALMFPIAGGIGLLFNRAFEVVADESRQILEGDVPQAFTPAGRGMIRHRVTAAQRIEIGMEDASRLAANAVCHHRRSKCDRGS